MGKWAVREKNNLGITNLMENTKNKDYNKV
jgi:hypothetical protein